LHAFAPHEKDARTHARIRTKYMCAQTRPLSRGRFADSADGFIYLARLGADAFAVSQPETQQRLLAMAPCVQECKHISMLARCTGWIDRCLHTIFLCSMLLCQRSIDNTTLHVFARARGSRAPWSPSALHITALCSVKCLFCARTLKRLSWPACRNKGLPFDNRTHLAL
jgi:hypothetical protein